MKRQPTLLLLSQFFPPDPTSVGQHMADVALEMARRGYRVIVYCANRGYEDPSVRFAAREERDGIEIRRLPFSSFGKSSIRARLIGGLSFVVQCILRGMWIRRDMILVSTSPPFTAIAALVLGWSRRTGVGFWVMDLNPDQALALGVARPGSLSVRLFETLNRLILARADRIVALDRFMAERLRAKRASIDARMETFPPWPHDDHLDSIPHAKNSFRAEQGWQERFVFMFSGNLSIASPADTLMEAALRVQDDERALFAFIGGGLGRIRLGEFIERYGPRNIVTLPYQPLETLGNSLSAADVHLVTMGDDMAGIIHPSKVYGAMSVGRPVLFLGPSPSHVTDILEEFQIGWHVRHGDVDGAERIIREILALAPEELRARGERARRAVRERFSRELLAGRFGDVMEATVTARS